MYTLYRILPHIGKVYFVRQQECNGAIEWTTIYSATQFRTIEAANLKAHELNLDEYYIEDEHGNTVYPMKGE